METECLHIITRRVAINNGLKRYFTGKPCKHGHIDQRWSVSAKCMKCHEDQIKPLRLPRLSTEEKKQKARTRAKRWYKKNKALTKNRAKAWKKENRDRVRISEAKWRKKSKSKAITFMRDSLRRVLKIEKKGRTEAVLGYTRCDLVEHIESLFHDGMTWDNHGEWHIDHITPISFFLDSGINDPSIINSLANLRPIWASDNLKKGMKLENNI